MEAKDEWTIRLNWFKERVGKIVFRNKTSCKCLSCKNVYENGLAISDEMHASYLHDIESGFTAEGHPIRYFDTIEERNNYETELNKL